MNDASVKERARSCLRTRDPYIAVTIIEWVIVKLVAKRVRMIPMAIPKTMVVQAEENSATTEVITRTIDDGERNAIAKDEKVLGVMVAVPEVTLEGVVEVDEVGHGVDLRTLDTATRDTEMRSLLGLDSQVFKQTMRCNQWEATHLHRRSRRTLALGHLYG
jgi:hypothetical protein